MRFPLQFVFFVETGLSLKAGSACVSLLFADFSEVVFLLSEIKNKILAIVHAKH
jgi:hypothetical protein